MQARHIKYIIGILLLASDPAHSGDAPSQSQLCKTSAGTQFCVPKDYIPWGIDTKSESFLIEAQYPGFSPLPDRNMRGGGTILIYFDHHKNHHQNESAIAYRLQTNPASETIDTNGLRSTERAGGNVGTDIFYAPNADVRGSQPELIRCDAHQPGAVYAQAYDCALQFRHDKHYFDVRFRRAWLPQWRSIKTETINFIAEFETSSFKE